MKNPTNTDSTGGRSYEELLEYVTKAVEIVRRIGDGDLTVAIKPRFSDDVFGIALADTAENLRGMLGQGSDSASGIALATVRWQTKPGRLGK